MDRLAVKPWGVILAGGRARRMGGDRKCLAPLGGRPLLTHVIERAAPQTAGLLLSINGESEDFRAYDLPMVTDQGDENIGPLAGILAACRWVKGHAPGVTHLAVFAADTPFFPLDLVACLAAREGAAVRPVYAAAGGHRHGLLSLWPLALADELKQAVTEQNLRRVDAALDLLGADAVDFPASPVTDFFNINTPGDLAAAERILSDRSDVGV